MPLMSTERWQKKTSKVFKDRKNPLITDIDTLLDAYHDPNKTDVQKHKLLVLIRHYCREWLAEKGEKKTSFRREYVEELRDQTTKELESPAMEAAVKQRLAGGNATLNGKQMVEHAVEMLQPRGNVKDKHGLKADLQFTRISAPKIENAAHQRNVDLDDTVAVLDLIQDQKRKKALTTDLEYLQKGDRQKYQVTLEKDGRLHRGGQQAPHSSPSGAREMFAMDQMGFLYTANAPAKYGSFHHTSFLSGKPVMCAGEIEIRQGQVTYVSNGSGHYKPGKDDLLNCLSELRRRYQVDLKRVAIEDFGQQGVTWNDADHYLLLNGTPPKALPPPPAVSRAAV